MVSRVIVLSLFVAACGAPAPAPATLAPEAPAPDAAPSVQAPSAPAAAALPDCAASAEQIQLAVKAAPGLAQGSDNEALPIYRGYVPARLAALACPVTAGCRVPEGVELGLWVAKGSEALTPSPLAASRTVRGPCVEAVWEARADVVWPDAAEGVVRWAVLVGPQQGPGDAVAWKAAGRLAWEADVIHAGAEGSPRVE